jgi:hypothetical protein
VHPPPTPRHHHPDAHAHSYADAHFDGNGHVHRNRDVHPNRYTHAHADALPHAEPEVVTTTTIDYAYDALYPVSLRSRGERPPDSDDARWDGYLRLQPSSPSTLREAERQSNSKPRWTPPFGPIDD